MFVIARGNAFEGLTLVGPFPTKEAAETYSADYDGGDYCIVPVLKPTDVPREKSEVIRSPEHRKDGEFLAALKQVAGTDVADPTYFYGPLHALNPHESLGHNLGISHNVASGVTQVGVVRAYGLIGQRDTSLLDPNKFHLGVGTAQAFVNRQEPWFMRHVGRPVYDQKTPIVSDANCDMAKAVLDRLNAKEIDVLDAIKEINEKWE